MLVPLYGFLEGDTMGVLVLAHDNWTVAEVAERLRASSRIRVDCRDPLEVFKAGGRLAPTATVRQLGLQALDCIDVRRQRDISAGSAPAAAAGANGATGRVP